MKLLLDTHILVWMINQPQQISRQEHRAILRASMRYASAVSFWEMRIKWNLRDRSGRRKGLVDPERAIAFAVQNDIEIVALIEQDSLCALTQTLSHRDPFDEMLIVQAQRLGAKLLTRDSLLVDHPLAYHP